MREQPPENRSDTVRYAPRAVEDDAWIEALLLEEPMGVVGLVDDGSPYLVNQLFVYDPEAAAIYFHGAHTGKTRRLVEGEGSNDACLTVSRMGRLLPAEMPVDFDVEYESVVVYGTVDLVKGEEAKRAVLEQIMAKFAPQLAPGEDYEPIAASSIERTSVYRLDVEGWSGKENEIGQAFEGAYDYEAVRDAAGR